MFLAKLVLAKFFFFSPFLTFPLGFPSNFSAFSLSKPSPSLSRSSSTYRLFSQSSTAYNSFIPPGTDQSSDVAKKRLKNYNIMQRSSFSAADMGNFLSDHTPEDSQDQYVEPDLSSNHGQSSILSRTSNERGAILKPSLLASIFWKQRKLIYSSLSQSELLDRFKKILVVATDLAVMFSK